VAGSLVWNLREQAEKTLEMARNSATHTIESDVQYRRWAARQGGVYVPASDDTPPNPYLKVADRDVTTTSGVRLTLVNPAYMVRLVRGSSASSGGARVHITSLRPMRPQNRPDAWECAALEDFEKGVEEVSSVEPMSDGEYLRMMRPFVAERACLKCHAAQGYREGDIRGGISISVPMAPLRAAEKAVAGNLALAHLGLWLIGVAGIAVGRRTLRRQMLARERAEADLHAGEARFRAFMDNSPGIAWIKDEQGRYVYLSKSFERRFGVKLEEWRGKTDFELWPPETAQAFRDNDLAVLGDGQTRQVPEETCNPDGTTNYWWTFKFLIRDAAGRKYVAGSGVDITERKQAEEQIQRHVAELRAANEELTRLTRAMAGRELRMIELKQEVNDLCARAGEPARYPQGAEKEDVSSPA